MTTRFCFFTLFGLFLFLFTATFIISNQDDDGESDHDAAASDISQASSAHSSRVTADGGVVTKV